MASDYLLELDGVKGESKDDAHKETIEILSWSFGASNPTRRVGGKVSYSDISFRARIDKATPVLFEKLRARQILSGTEHYLHGRRSSADGKRGDYLKIKLVDILVSSVHIKYDGEGEAYCDVTLKIREGSTTVTEGA